MFSPVFLFPAYTTRTRAELAFYLVTCGAGPAASRGGEAARATSGARRDCAAGACCSGAAHERSGAISATIAALLAILFIGSSAVGVFAFQRHVAPARAADGYGGDGAVGGAGQLHLGLALHAQAILGL